MTLSVLVLPLRQMPHPLAPKTYWIRSFTRLLAYVDDYYKYRLLVDQVTIDALEVA